MTTARWIARALSVVLDFERGRFYVGWLWVVGAAVYCVVCWL